MSPSEASTTRVGVVRRLFRPIVELRDGESTTAVLMFAYSFLAMTAYNVIKPITRSKFISSLGADNLPYVQLAAGLLIGVLMQAYSVLVARLPRRYVAPLTLAGMSFLLVAFWLLFRSAGDWVSVGFYLLGLILGLLLISQFWTLANDIFDARQAKRLFGFIGAGASLGAIFGSGMSATFAQRIGSQQLLLIAVLLLEVAVLCIWRLRVLERRSPQLGGERKARRDESEPVRGGWWEAFTAVARSPYLLGIAARWCCRRDPRSARRSPPTCVGKVRGGPARA